MDLEKNIPNDSCVDNTSSDADSPNATKPHPSGSQSPHSNDGLVMDPLDPGEAEVVNIRQGNSVLRSLRDFETWMDRKLNFEAMGVERIPENKRKPPQILNASAPTSIEAVLVEDQVTDIPAR